MDGFEPLSFAGVGSAATSPAQAQGAEHSSALGHRSRAGRLSPRSSTRKSTRNASRESPRRGRPLANAQLSHALARMWDEVDYGVVLLNAHGQALYTNHMARVELASARALAMAQGCVEPVLSREIADFGPALRLACSGQRVMRRYGDMPALLVSFVPVAGTRFDDLPGAAGQGSAPQVMLTMGKRMVVSPATLMLFARMYGLTAAECKVLGALCDGLDTAHVAQRLHVAASTIVTHERRLRQKTGCGTLRELLLLAACAPPVVCAVRGQDLQR